MIPENTENTEIDPKRKRNPSSAEKSKSEPKRIKTVQPVKYDLDSTIADEEAEKMEQVLNKLEKLDKLDEIQADIKSMKNDLKDYKTSLEFTQAELKDAKQTISEIQLQAVDTETRIDSLHIEMHELRLRNSLLEDRILDQESYSRRENILVYGISEKENEDAIETAYSLLRMLDIEPKSVTIQRCHRIGNKSKNMKTPRPLILRVNFQDKVKISQARHKLKGSKIFLDDDYPKEIQTKRRCLKSVIKLAKTHDAKARLVKDQLYIDDKPYTLENIKDCPVDTTSLGCKITDTHVLFSGEFSALSTLYPCVLTIDGRSYNSVEQYFQSEKCRQASQLHIQQRVMAACTGRDAMEQGRSVKPTAEWLGKKGIEAMRKAMTAQQDQCAEFRDALQGGKGKTFAEASRNPFWGTGIPLHDDNACDVASWSGKNNLGKILDDMCEDLCEDMCEDMCEES
jgi:ribA/ribD-fused uncharacterized protein